MILMFFEMDEEFFYFDMNNEGFLVIILILNI